MSAPDDILTQAAQRAEAVMPGGTGKYVRLMLDWCRQTYEQFSVSSQIADKLAYAVLSLPVSAPARGYGKLVCRRCDVQAAFCPCEKPDVSAPDREALARIAHGEHRDISTTSVRDIPSPWQAVEDALDRLISAGVVAQSPAAQDGAEFIGETHWRIVTEVPLRLPQEDRDEILGLITDTAASWAEQARDTGDDWDANVYGYVQPATPSIPVSCVGQEVEWNVEDSVWTPGRVESLTENTAVITVHDNGERLVVEKRFLRARASSREAGQP